MEVACDRRYRFPLAPAELWMRISDVDRFRSWWPWLRRFDARALERGDVWQCAVRPPLPYVVRFAVALDDVVVERSIAASVTGDVVGRARIDIISTGSGCEVRVTSSLRPAKPVLRVISLVAQPVARFGHNWVIDTGARQFAERTLLT